MPPELVPANVPVMPRTHGVEPRRIQTSGIFRVPTEVILGILAHFGDPHHCILLADRMPSPSPGVYPRLGIGLVEQLTTIRKLTMTCWHLRNMLIPLLWEYTEGRSFFPPRPPAKCHGGLNNGLYAQCTYLLLNPTVSVYVQTLSVDLHFKDTPKDLMTKFVDCLVQLSNLRTLEVFATNDVESLARGLKRESARFTGIHELGISDSTATFVGNCPNVETITVLHRLLSDGTKILSSHIGELKKLKRVIGIPEGYVRLVAQSCPDLQEIGIKGWTECSGSHTAHVEVTELLQSLRRLAVVEFDYHTYIFLRNGMGSEDCADKQEELLEEWARLLVPVLKGSSSKERKFLRWKFSEFHFHSMGQAIGPVKSRVLEVFPETSPAV